MVRYLFFQLLVPYLVLLGMGGFLRKVSVGFGFVILLLKISPIHSSSADMLHLVTILT